jgi:hypothetical protein
MDSFNHQLVVLLAPPGVSQSVFNIIARNDEEGSLAFDGNNFENGFICPGLHQPFHKNNDYASFDVRGDDGRQE